MTTLKFPMLRFQQHSEISLDEAILHLLEFSPAIAILQTDVLSSREEITKEGAEFDWQSFVQVNWDERNVPVGSDLDGALDRLESHTLSSSAGFIRRTSLGGKLKLAQDLGYVDSNSQFFTPSNQANSQIALAYTQPLLQGAGNKINRSRINIAKVTLEIDKQDLVNGLQAQVFAVATAYWELVAQRGIHLINQQLYDRALQTATIVANRANVDVSPLQSARAEATLGARRSRLLESEYAIVFAQEKLLRLIFGGEFQNQVDREIIPISPLLDIRDGVNTKDSVAWALQQRPEIKRVLEQIKVGAIEQGIARNQLLPALGLTLSFSNRGLRGNRALAGALEDQFNLGDPTYGIGLNYTLPVRNRAAKASLRQSNLRVEQFQKQLEQVAADVTLEVRNAVHSLVFTAQQKTATRTAMQLASKELTTLRHRAEFLVDGDQFGPLYLDNLLQTQERLAAAELSYLNAAVRLAIADFALQRATGSLLRSQTLPPTIAPQSPWRHEPIPTAPTSAADQPDIPPTQ